MRVHGKHLKKIEKGLFVDEIFLTPFNATSNVKA